MEELNLFPPEVTQSLDVLLVAFDEDSHKYAFEVLSQLRVAGIKADLYPTPAKLKKQMKYANDIKVPKVILIGSEEKETGLLTVKNMVSGEQEKVVVQELIKLMDKANR